MKKYIFLSILFMFCLSCVAEGGYTEIFRPEFHYTPAANWMNDPNGLVYNEATKEYHMYYQYCKTLKEDQMQKYWGHAVSKDIINWEEKPVAISPDKYGSIWSGSCVIDKNNTSGLFDESIPKESRMVAFFTYAGGDTEYGYEKQGLAYSLDGGSTFKKYNKPVITNEKDKYDGGFRDPKVIWYEDGSYENGGIWIMVVAGGKARLFTSSNLKDWEFNSVLKYKDNSDIISECPDFYPMKVEGSDETKWVFSGAGRFYVTGNLVKDKDGKFMYRAETQKQSFVSDGTELYASQTFNNEPNGRRVAIYWMIDLYSKNMDAGHNKVWDGVQSVPMELKLYKQEETYVIKANPVSEINLLRKDNIFSTENIKLTQESENILKDIQSKCFEIEALLSVEDASKVIFGFRKGATEKTELIYNVKTNNMTFVRRNSGIAANSNMSVSVKEDKIKLRILVDNSVVDIFVNDGEKILNGHIFPESNSTGMSLSVEGGEVTVDSINVYSLDTIWNKKDANTPPPAQTKTKNNITFGTIEYIVVIAAVTFSVCAIICVIATRKRK